MSPLRLPTPVRAALRLGVNAALALGLILMMGIDAQRSLSRSRGIEDGLDERVAPLVVPRFGTNVSLERYSSDVALIEALEMARGLGFGTLRQRFAWADLEPAPGVYRWEFWDSVLPIVKANGLEVIAVLDTSPEWARPPWEADNRWSPPTRSRDYAQFVGAFARRYGEFVSGYQVWDQPNIAPHWGKGPIDPAAYLDLLRLASETIHRSDPGALVIAGALAPNTEAGGRDMSDVQFLREIYRRGAWEHFDVLGVKLYGFWTGADDRRVSKDVLNFSRVILLREEMIRRGDASKPVWALEAGWCALPSDWEGTPSPQGSDEPFVQIERLRRAIRRVRLEWPWMGLVCMLHLQPNAPPDDPVWGYALVGPDDVIGPVTESLRHEMNGNQPLSPGLTRELPSYLGRLPESGAVDVAFFGTDLVLQLRPAVGHLAVTVDEATVEEIVELDGDHAMIVSMSEGLDPGLHSLRLRATSGALKSLSGIQVGYRPWSGPLSASRRALPVRLLVGFLGVVWLSWRMTVNGRLILWSRAWSRIRGPWHSLPSALRWTLMVLPVVVAVVSRSSSVDLGALVVYGLIALLGPEQALLLAVASIPFAPLHVGMRGLSFSLTEVCILVAFAAHVWNAVLTSRASTRLRGEALGLTREDWAVIVLATAGLGLSLLAEYTRVALREWRVMLLSPALFYATVRARARTRETLVLLADVLVLSATCVALYALIAYVAPWGVIEAEGVRRARAFYGSPNNLALLLERVLPMAATMALCGRTRRRRQAYGLAGLAMVLALFLTFSRGAWLIALPVTMVGLVVVGKVAGKWLVIALVVVALLAIVPLLGTERLASLLTPSRGTPSLRLSLWSAAWDMVLDHPFLGVGPDNFLYYYGDYVLPGAEVERWLSHPHNLFLDFWVRLGLGGVAWLGLVLYSFFLRGRRGHLSVRHGDTRAVLLGFVVGMAAAIAHGLVDAFYFVPELAAWFMLALAWVVGMRNEDEPVSILGAREETRF